MYQKNVNIIVISYEINILVCSLLENTFNCLGAKGGLCSLFVLLIDTWAGGGSTSPVVS